MKKVTNQEMMKVEGGVPWTSAVACITSCLSFGYSVYSGNILLAGASMGGMLAFC